MKDERRRKGFTLIELLAVIVILAVIALIASPLIINIIESSRKKAFENSVYGVMSTYDIKTIGDKEAIGKTYNFPEGNEELKYSGTKMIGGSIFLTPSGSIEVRRITDGRYCASGNKTNLVIKRGDCTIDLAVDPVLKHNSQFWEMSFLETDIMKTDIESIEIVMVSEFPSGAIDVSDKGNSSVMLWSKDENSNGMVEIYIGAIDDFVYANPNSSYLFSNIENVGKVDLPNFNTETATNMSYMFSNMGLNNLNFTLNLGDEFDTSNVINMHRMFHTTSVGHNSIKLTLELGNKFDTSKVTDMVGMFEGVGRSSPNFTLNLGSNFDTSEVTSMDTMFGSTGSDSEVFTLDLGDKFNTSKVTSMDAMFYATGLSSPIFNLNLGDKFDTSKVTNMRYMFLYVGMNNPIFMLDLGTKFDTNEVVNMEKMFSLVGYSNPVFTLDLGNKFSVASVTNYNGTFNLSGNANPSFKPTAQVKTQPEKDAILSKFPNIEVTIVP